MPTYALNPRDSTQVERLRRLYALDTDTEVELRRAYVLDTDGRNVRLIFSRGFEFVPSGVSSGTAGEVEVFGVRRVYIPQNPTFQSTVNYRILTGLDSEHVARGTFTGSDSENRDPLAFARGLRNSIINTANHSDSEEFDTDWVIDTDSEFAGVVPQVDVTFSGPVNIVLEGYHARSVKLSYGYGSDIPTVGVTPQRLSITTIEEFVDALVETYGDNTVTKVDSDTIRVRRSPASQAYELSIYFFRDSEISTTWPTAHIASTQFEDTESVTMSRTNLFRSGTLSGNYSFNKLGENQRVIGEFSHAEAYINTMTGGGVYIEFDEPGNVQTGTSLVAHDLDVVFLLGVDINGSFSLSDSLVIPGGTTAAMVATHLAGTSPHIMYDTESNILLIEPELTTPELNQFFITVVQTLPSSTLTFTPT